MLIVNNCSKSFNETVKHNKHNHQDSNIEMKDIYIYTYIKIYLLIDRRVLGNFNPLTPVFTLLSHMNNIFICGTLKYCPASMG